MRVSYKIYKNYFKPDFADFGIAGTDYDEETKTIEVKEIQGLKIQKIKCDWGVSSGLDYDDIEAEIAVTDKNEVYLNPKSIRFDGCEKIVKYAEYKNSSDLQRFAKKLF